METKEIIESNEQIALFMGLKVIGEQDFLAINSGDVDESYFVDVSLDYHTSFNSLMPVVEKILELKTYSQYKHRVFKSISPKIDITYKAVVEFIKWHNEQKLSHIEFDENGDNVIV